MTILPEPQPDPHNPATPAQRPDIKVEQHIHGVSDSGRVVGVEYNISAETAYDVRGLPNPFLGLQSFTYADRAKYGGRSREIAEAVSKLTSPDSPQSLLFVTGASGSGKSSFAQAGLVPALERHYAEFTVKRAVFRPSANPLAGLGDALWRQLGLPSFDPTAAMPESFNAFLRDQTPPRQINLIVIDQLEELFTQPTAQPPETLVNLLTHLPPFSPLRTHFIATLRADYLPDLFAIPALYEVAKHGVELRAMSEDELSEAIQQPLRTAYPDGHKRFEPALVAKLAHDSAEDAAYLPLLQVTLEELWRRGSLTLGSYGSLTDAIQKRADKVLAFIDYDEAAPKQPREAADQASILELCLDLVDPSPDDDYKRDVRRGRTLAELVSGSPRRARFIEVLTQARLLSTNAEETMSAVPAAPAFPEPAVEWAPDSTGQPPAQNADWADRNQHPNADPSVEVDIIHETLLTNWYRLRSAIAVQRQKLRQRARFEQQLKEWLSSNRSDDYLLTGVRQAEARELEKLDDIALRGADAKAIVRRSVEQAEAEQQEKLRGAQRVAAAQKRAATLLRWVAIVLLSGVIGTSGAAMFAVEQNGVANEQRSNAVNEAHARATAEAQAVQQRNVAVTEVSARATAEAQAVQQRNVAVNEANARATAEARAVGAQKISFSRELAASALGQLGRDADLGTLLALRSLTETYTNEGEDALRQALETLAVRSVLNGHTATVNAAAYRPDGQFIVTASDDRTARVWEAATRNSVAELRGHTAPVTSAAFSPDGRYIVTASADGTARIWEIATSKTVAELRGHTASVTSAAFSPDGRYIVTASKDNTARVWEIATGKSVFELREHTAGVNSAVFSPDGKFIVTASDDLSARVWRADTGADVRIMRGFTSSVNRAAYSPDGQFIIVAGGGQKARVWRADASLSVAGAALQILEGHTATVWSAAYSPDGRFIVTASGDPDSDDNTARVWRSDSGAEIRVLKGHTAPVRSAAFSPDGQFIITASSDRTARIYFAQLDGMLQFAKAKVSRDFSCSERAAYLHDPCPAGPTRAPFALTVTSTPTATRPPTPTRLP